MTSKQSETLHLRGGHVRATVAAADGGRLTSLAVAGVELLAAVGAGVLEHGSFVMAPWAGRIRDGVLRFADVAHHLPTDRTPPHAGHGLVVDRPWAVLDASHEHALLRCDLDSRWPFPGHVLQRLALTDEHLDQQVEVHAHAHAFPATVGWHPWFPRVVAGSVAELAFRAEGMLLRDGHGIPSGQVIAAPPGPWDDCFVGVRWPATITWPGVLALGISADVDFAVVYDEREPAFCIEPQSGPPDGPNTAPRVVEPDRPLVATTRWTWG